MEHLKDVDLSNMTAPQRKSWVASRFTLIDDAGIAKRRCRFPQCDKEYSRGTSHMILKRHWSKQHADLNCTINHRPTNSPAFNRHKSNNNNNNSNNNTSTTHNNSNNHPTNSNNNTGGGKKSKQLNNQNTTNNSSNSSATNIGTQDLNHKPNKTGSHSSNSNANSKNSNDRLQPDVKLVAKRLKEAISIHLTFDIYTPKKGGKSYGIITAHSFGDSLDLKSVLLEYRHLPYPDDSTVVFEFLRSCITKFNIKEKIISLVSNASATIANAVQEMDKRYRLSKNFSFSTVHLRCFPQFVHINVQDIFRTQEALLETVRKVISLINSNNITLRPIQQQDAANTNATGALPTVVDNNSVLHSSNIATNNNDQGTKATGLKLPYDNRSSWNTTFNMIETFVQQRDFIEPTLLYFQNPQDMTSNVNIDWDRLYTLVQLLKPFHDVVNKFAVDNYTPVSLVAVSLPHLMEHLSSSSWAYDDLGMAAHNFKIQLETYQSLFQSDLTVIAGLLDPRVKDTFVTPEGREYAIDILRKRLDNAAQNKSDFQVNQYPEHSVWSRVFRPCNFDEVTDYLDHPREHGCTNSFAYWEAHKNVYPCLYYLAKALICVQATSVPSDRLFSAGENTDKEKRVQMDSTNSKELMKSWARYLEK